MRCSQTIPMISNKKIQVIYHPGMFGNLLRWLLDRFSTDCKFKHINDPWDNDNRVHGQWERNPQFIRGHQTDDHNNSPDSEADKIVINFAQDQFLFAERCGLYRNPGCETEEGRYKMIIDNADVKLLDLFNIDKDKSCKAVAKELYKIQLHDHDNHIWWNNIFKFMSGSAHYQFTADAFWNKELFVQQLQNISDRFSLNLKIDETIIDSVVEKISDSYPVKTKDRAIDILQSIKNKESADCSELDILEQAWIEVILEKDYDSVLFPYGTNWFRNIDQINEFIDTYPSYLKHMNPRLPWYNGIKNPFYLTGKL